MKHLGDITKLNGAEIPPVDVITGGSPCQDLSNAGKKAGLAGERSGLFLEQIRVIKEMREHDRSNGRAAELIRPRYMVFENVIGTFSSNNGKDFQTVLTEIVKIVCREAPDIPVPDRGGWSKYGSLCGMGDSGTAFSVAWRVHDAQYHGVPQRRKRLCVLADFNGFTAPWILFDPQFERTAQSGQPDSVIRYSGRESRPSVQSVGKGVSGDSEQGEEEGQDIAGATEDRPGTASAISFQERAGKPGGQGNIDTGRTHRSVVNAEQSERLHYVKN